MKRRLSWLLSLVWWLSQAESVQFRVLEGAPRGFLLGHVLSPPAPSNQVNFFVAYSDSTAEEALHVDEHTGEVRVVGEIDFEEQRRFELLAVPLAGGEGIPVSVIVEDLNDNAPEFPKESMILQISEVARRGSRFALPSAVDGDSPPLDVQSYRIVRGNLNNVFRLQTRKVDGGGEEGGGHLLLELEVIGMLDREFRDHYELVIEACDGGDPAKVGELRVEIVVLDVNDNAPVWTEKSGKYSIRLSPSSMALLSQPILSLSATDSDDGDNGRVSFRLANTRADVSSFFSLSPNGSLYASPSVPEGDFELVVVACDAGQPSLETSATVSVVVERAAREVPRLDIVWLTPSAEAAISENATLAAVVARVSLAPNDDSLQVEMSGCSSLCLRESDHTNVFLLSVCAPLDREAVAEYQLVFGLKEGSHLLLEHPQLLQIVDVNDQRPSWPSRAVRISLNRSADEDVDLSAIDADEGENGRLSYSIHGTNLVFIDQESGRIRLAENECPRDSPLEFEVEARDGGSPPLSSRLSVTADIVGLPGWEPRCSLPLYETTVREDIAVGSCLLEVSAWKDEKTCEEGEERGRIRYSLRESTKSFSVDPATGRLCVERSLDYEEKRIHRLSVLLSREGFNETATCGVSVRVEDVNDNSPLFSPLLYNSSFLESEVTESSILLLRLAAFDADHGAFGMVKYRLVSPSEFFEVDEKTGDVRNRRRLPLGVHHFEVAALDGGGRQSAETAVVNVAVEKSSEPLPRFVSSSPKRVTTSEDMLPGIAIGSVAAMATGGDPLLYSIYSGDPHHLFAIHPRTAKITVAKYLDSDKHQDLLINVKAYSKKGVAGYSQLLIHIEDHNDNSPTFPSDSVDVHLREDHPLDKPFYALDAVDRDRGKNGEISYSLLSSSPPGPFIVHPLLGQLRLSAPLDYEITRVYRLLLRAEDGGVPPKRANITVIVHLIDVNDNRPLFEKDQYHAKVVENCVQGTSVVRVAATDADSGAGGRVEFSLDNSQQTLPFSIDSRSGLIFTRLPIDREKTPFFNFTVIASDKGVPRQSSSVPMKVTVLDMNDNTPSCSSIIPLTVTSNADVRQSIGTIVALDPDDGENGTLIYRPQQHNSFFLVKTNGEVLIRRQLSQEEGHHLQMAVVVSDGGTPPKSTVCQVSINISEGESAVLIGDISHLDIDIPTHCSPPCPLRQLNATGVVEWRLQSSDVSSHFSISSNGMISLASPLSLRSVRKLTVVLVDGEGRQKRMTFRLHPATTNKEATRVVRVPISTPVGSSILDLSQGQRNSGILNDDNDLVFYSLLNHTEIFEIDAGRGTVHVIHNLAFFNEDIDEAIELRFRRTNVSSMASSEQTVWVEFERDLPLRPVFDLPFTQIQLQEDTSIGSIVGKVEAKTPEKAAAILYRIVDENAIFSADPATGQIALQKSLDSSMTPRITAVVVAEVESIEATSAVLFLVNDTNNHAPVIISSQTIRLREEGAAGAPFHFVVARDNDVGDNGRIRYFIQSNHSEMFAMDENTGALSLLSRVSSDLSIVVRAEDCGTPSLSTQQTLLIQVEHANWHFFDRATHWVRLHSSHPKHILYTFPTNKSVRLSVQPENIPFRLLDGELKVDGALSEDKYIITVLAEEKGSEESDWMALTVTVGDTKPPQPKVSSMSCHSIAVPENKKMSNIKQIVAVGPKMNATFRIEGGNELNLFRIDEQSGVISCDELDREKKSHHLLVITLSDRINTDTCTVHIRVHDENDNPPRLTSVSDLHLNDTDEGSVVISLLAEDEDEGDNGRIAFELIEDPSQVLDISSDGKLILARDVAYEKREWEIKVRIFDHGISQQLESVWPLRVIDIRNRNVGDAKRPAFLRQSYAASVAEGQGRGIELARVETSSAGVAPITFSIVEGNIDFAFDVDNYGRVQTAAELDREIRGVYSLSILATSSAFSSPLQTRVAVSVLNVNDNPPTVQAPIRRRISEATPPGTFISRISATDVDEDTILEYSLSSPSSFFAIDRFTGIIHTISSIDRELSEQITLSIIVSDGLHCVESELILSILDENDNSPHFSTPFYDILLPPSLLPNSSLIARITATDADAEENGRIEYSLDGDDSLFFTLDHQNGELRAKSGEALSTRRLFSVVATDHGSPRRSSSIGVRTRPAASAGRTPCFTQSLYSFSVSEATPAQLSLGVVSMTSTRLLPFRISEAAMAALFRIDNHGHLYSRRPFDRESKASYRFEVDVGDAWKGLSANSSATVVIEVRDENDNSPVFEKPPSPIILSDSMKKGDIVCRLSARDADEGENGRVSYRILAGNDESVLSIDEESGVIHFVEWTDELLQRPSLQWTIVVQAEDNGQPLPRSALQLIQLQVQAEGSAAAAPFFPLQSYELFVLEDTKINTTLHQLRAISRRGLPLHQLLFTLTEENSHFELDQHSGLISLRESLDYEKKKKHKMTVGVHDKTGRSAVSPVTVHVLPVDEFAPVFSRASYTFHLPLDASAGFPIGRVEATDGDEGRDGVVRFRLSRAKLSPSSTAVTSSVQIDESSGELRLSRALSLPKVAGNISLHQLSVIAASGPMQQTSILVYLQIGTHPSQTSSTSSSGASLATLTFLLASGILLLLLFILLICICIKYQARTSDVIDHSKKRVYSVNRHEPTQLRDDVQSSPAFVPLPASVQMSSMDSCLGGLVSGRSQPDSGIDPDALSLGGSSVSEYLASLGVGRLPPASSSTTDPVERELLSLLPPGSVNLARYSLINTNSIFLPFYVEEVSTGKRLPQPLTNILSRNSAEENEENSASWKESRKESVEINV